MSQVAPQSSDGVVVHRPNRTSTEVTEVMRYHITKYVQQFASSFAAVDRANLTGSMTESQREAAAAAHFEKRKMYDAVSGDKEEMKEAAALHVDKCASTWMSSWRVLKGIDKLISAAGAAGGRLCTNRKGPRSAVRRGAGRAGVCARVGQAAPTYEDGVVEHDDDKDFYPAAFQARPVGTKTAKAHPAAALSLAREADATRPSQDRMAGVAERLVDNALWGGPDVRRAPEAARWRELDMRRRVEVLGQTHDSDTEAPEN